jgi:cell division protein FtsZ
MVMPGLINLDFADIRTVMSEMGKAMMGTGEAEGPRRAIDAAEAAISNPLLDEVSLKGARAMLINITAGMDIALFEVDEAVNRVRSEVDPDANVIFGSTFDPTMEGRLRVSVVATGIDAGSAVQHAPIRQPTLDVIRGGADAPTRKSSFGGFAAMGNAAPLWPAASAGMMAQPVSMTATAQKLEPVAYETLAPVAAAPVAAAPDMVAPEIAEAQESAVPSAPEPAPVSFAPAPELAVENYIPPRPTEAPPRQALPPQMLGLQPLAQAAPAVEKKKAYSLFERVTGAARRAESAPVPTPQPQRSIPTLGTAIPARAQHHESNIAPAGQPRLGIDGPARPKASSPEDDLLEIPAFLRRQAN